VVAVTWHADGCVLSQALRCWYVGTFALLLVLRNVEPSVQDRLLHYELTCLEQEYVDVPVHEGSGVCTCVTPGPPLSSASDETLLRLHAARMYQESTRDCIISTHSSIIPFEKTRSMGKLVKQLLSLRSRCSCFLSRHTFARLPAPTPAPFLFCKGEERNIRRILTRFRITFGRIARPVLYSMSTDAMLCM
jgi:hypothetical protein